MSCQFWTDTLQTTAIILLAIGVVITNRTLLRMIKTLFPGRKYHVRSDWSNLQKPESFD